MRSNFSYREFLVLRTEASKVWPKSFNPVDALILKLMGEKQLSLVQKEDAFLKITRRLKSSYEKQRYIILKKRCVNLFSSRRIIWFITEPTEHKVCFPIAKELKKRGLEEIVISTKPTLSKKWKNAGFEVIDFSPSYMKKKNTKYVALVDQFIDIIKDNNFSEEQLIFLKRTLLIHLPYMLSWQKEVNDWLSHVHPHSICFLGNDATYLLRQVGRLAKAKELHTISIQHGDIAMDFAYREQIVHKFILWGSFSENRLLDLGIERGRLIVLGNPHLDEILSLDRSEKVKRLASLLDLDGISPDNCVLIALSGPGHRTSEAHHKMHIDSIYRLAKKNPEIIFIFKLHRKDKIEYYNSHPLCSSLKNIRNLQVDEGLNNIYDWLQLTNAVITGNSTVGAEALLMKKPVFTLDYIREYHEVAYREFGASLHASSHEELLNKFNSYRADGISIEYLNRRSSFVKEYFSDFLGESTIRCADFIEDQWNYIKKR